MATALDTAKARISTKSTTGRVSLKAGASVGISGRGEGREDLPRTNHMTKVNAIQMADPMSQASAWFHGWEPTHTGEASRSGQGQEEPDVEEDPGHETVHTEIDRQPAERSDHKGGKDHEPPGLSSNAKSKGREHRTDEADQSHATQPVDVIATRVTQPNEQYSECHAEEVPLLVDSGHDDKRYQ